MNYTPSKNNKMYCNDIYYSKIKTKTGKDDLLIYYRNNCSDQDKIIGYINADDFSDAKNYDENIYEQKSKADVSYNTTIYKDKPKRTKLVGFVEVADKQVIGICKSKKIFPFIIVGLVLIGIIISGSFVLGNFIPDKTPNDNPPLVITDGVKNTDIETPTNAKNVVYANVKGKTKVTISEASKTVYLENNEENEGLYFQYEVYIDGKDTPIYVSDFIRPGESDPWNAYDTVGLINGENIINYVINIKNKEQTIDSSTVVNGILIIKE